MSAGPSRKRRRFDADTICSYTFYEFTKMSSLSQAALEMLAFYSVDQETHGEELCDHFRLSLIYYRAMKRAELTRRGAEAEAAAPTNASSTSLAVPDATISEESGESMVTSSSLAPPSASAPPDPHFTLNGAPPTPPSSTSDITVHPSSRFPISSTPLTPHSKQEGVQTPPSTTPALMHDDNLAITSSPAEVKAGPHPDAIDSTAPSNSKPTSHEVITTPSSSAPTFTYDPSCVLAPPTASTPAAEGADARPNPIYSMAPFSPACSLVINEDPEEPIIAPVYSEYDTPSSRVFVVDDAEIARREIPMEEATEQAPSAQPETAEEPVIHRTETGTSLKEPTITGSPESPEKETAEPVEMKPVVKKKMKKDKIEVVELDDSPVVADMEVEQDRNGEEDMEIEETDSTPLAQTDETSESANGSESTTTMAAHPTSSWEPLKQQPTSIRFPPAPWERQPPAGHRTWIPAEIMQRSGNGPTPPSVPCVPPPRQHNAPYGHSSRPPYPSFTPMEPGLHGRRPMVPEFRGPRPMGPGAEESVCLSYEYGQGGRRPPDRPYCAFCFSTGHNEIHCDVYKTYDARCARTYELKLCAHCVRKRRPECSTYQHKHQYCRICGKHKSNEAFCRRVC